MVSQSELDMWELTVCPDPLQHIECCAVAATQREIPLCFCNSRLCASWFRSLNGDVVVLGGRSRVAVDEIRLP